MSQEDIAVPSWIIPAPLPATAENATTEDVDSYNNMLALQYTERHHRLALTRLAQRSKNPEKGRSLGGYIWVKTDEIGNPQIFVGDKDGARNLQAEFVIGGMWIHRVYTYNHTGESLPKFFVSNYTSYVGSNDKFLPNDIDAQIAKREGLTAHELPWNIRGNVDCACNNCQTHLAPWTETVKEVNKTIKIYREASAIEPVVAEGPSDRYSRRAMKWFIPYDMESENMGKLCEPIASQWEKIQNSRGWERKENTVKRGR